MLANETRFGLEGITVTGEGDDLTLVMAIQREWKDDAKGALKLVSYDPEAKEWGGVLYPLETPAEGAWVGLSEITAHGDYVYLIERDNQLADKAKVKQITRVPVAEFTPGKLGEGPYDSVRCASTLFVRAADGLQGPAQPAMTTPKRYYYYSY